MIENLFLVSLQASLLIAFIILFRKIFKKSHKIFTYVMWLVVLIRLCIPIQIESRYGLFSLKDVYVEENGIVAPMEGEKGNFSGVINDTNNMGVANDTTDTNTNVPKPDINNDSIIHQIQTQAPAGDLTQNGVIKEDMDNVGNVIDNISNNTNNNTNDSTDNSFNNGDFTEEHPIRPDNKIDLPDVITLISIVLISGMLIVAGFALSRIIIMRNKVRFAIKENDNIWVSDSIDFPFVAGIFKGRIYLPADIDDNQREYILLHEKMHIRHKDYFIRNIIAIVNIVYWWNPLIWYATYLMKQDMEMFCDESVMRQLERNRQKEYLSTLLMCAGQNSGIVPIMAFGESNVERRISHIMNIKKTRPYIVVALLLFAMVCFGGCVIKQNINEKDKEVGAVPENEITENGTTENDITENNTEDSNDEVTQEKETTSDSSKPLSKYDMSVVNKVPYEQNNTGKWDMYGYIFEERAFVSGIIPGEDVRTTFVVLCKYGCGTFEKAAQEAKASRNKVGFSDTWQIVEHIKHDYKLENGRYISENSQEFIEIFDSTIEIRDLSKSYLGKEYSYFIENDFINIFNETVNDQIYIIDDVTLEYNGKRYIHINSSPKKEKIVSNRTGYPQYDELLDKIDYINDTNPTHEGYRSIGVCYIYGYPNGYEEGGFYLIDLDNDGVEEMLLGENGQDAWYGTFYDIYTIKDGKLMQVCSGTERTNYKLCSGNIIWNNGSSSAANSWDAYYTYSDGKMNLIECVFLDGFYDGNPYGDDNLNDELFWCGSVIEDKYGTPITREQAMEINSKYEKVGFEFTCFSTVVYE